LLIQQAKNINEDEFTALGNQFTTTQWELPKVSEYKDDLPMPVFNNMTPVVPGASASPMIQITNGPPSEDSPVSEAMWVKVNKMVA